MRLALILAFILGACAEDTPEEVPDARPRGTGELMDRGLNGPTPLDAARARVDAMVVDAAPPIDEGPPLDAGLELDAELDAPLQVDARLPEPDAEADLAPSVDASPEPDAAEPEPDAARPPAELTGSWLLTFEADEDFFSFLALELEAGVVSGTAIDSFGLASIVGRLRGDALEFTKGYQVGASEGATFAYTGVLAGDEVRGTWSQVGSPENGGDFSAGRDTNLAPEALSGAWQVAADFGPVEANFEVDDSGHLTGEMSDEFGDSTLDGVFDRALGQLWFHKLYEDGADFWYLARLDGERIVEGVWARDSDGEVAGEWTAER